jgi:hypothetical protein
MTIPINETDATTGRTRPSTPNNKGIVTTQGSVKLPQSVDSAQVAVQGWKLEFNAKDGNNHNVRALGVQITAVTLGTDKQTVTFNASLQLTDDNKNYIDSNTSSLTVLVFGYSST